MKFIGKIKETLLREVEIEAENACEAKEKLDAMYKAEEIVLDADDFVCVESWVYVSPDEKDGYVDKVTPEKAAIDMLSTLDKFGYIDAYANRTTFTLPIARSRKFPERNVFAKVTKIVNGIDGEDSIQSYYNVAVKDDVILQWREYRSDDLTEGSLKKTLEEIVNDLDDANIRQ